ncbi:NXPE family member 3-like [Acanthaster planci]|uniref:NXPE family member 3-like n=1 Tax=Acanthaster planci TaxID=133434 RepID=A0A8B7YKC9_ACAPL|nr:NXPE family member 3-like [Acanthaster planci]
MPRGLCRLRRHGNWSGMCLYPHRRALGQTVFICERPAGVASCDSLFATKSDGSRITARIDELTEGREMMYLSSQNYRKPIEIADPIITIEAGSLEQSQGNKSTLPQCLPDQELPLSHGYWLNGRWHSLLCLITDWTTRPKLTSCLRNKNLILLGDSTTRQWFLGIHNLLGIEFERTPADRQFNWRRSYRELNTTLAYTAHPQLVGSLAVYLDEVRYEVDVLDGLTDPHCNYIVLVSPWAHFSQWTRASYEERTQRLRAALADFRQRCPAAKVVLKGPHARDHHSYEAAVYSSDVLLKEIEKINRRTLYGIGIWYLPVWAMNSAHPAPNTVHMPMDVIREELKMFFSYVCS